MVIPNIHPSILKHVILFTCILCIPYVTNAQEKEYNTASIKINKYVEGTLITPYSNTEVPLIILIMDAGAINRDGNDRMSQNNAFKKLAIVLAKQGIATFSYDKRLFKMDALGIKETDITIDHFVTDAVATIQYFKRNKNYTNIIIAGHGQGALVGMLAAKENADAFISIAGNGQAIDQIIIGQLQKQAPGLDRSAYVAFQELKEKGSTTNYDPALASIFRYSLQGFMRSWIKYTPTKEIASLKIPILIIHGDQDIQVAVSEAKRLKNAAPNSTYVIIPYMNHILTKIKGSRLENQKSYNETWRTIMPEISTTIANFAHSL